MKRSLLRLFLGLGAVLGAIVLFRSALLPALQLAFDPGEATTSAIRRTGIFLSVLLAYWGQVRLLEKRKVTELRLAPAAIPLGALSGAVLISLTTLSLFALGAYEVIAVRGLNAGLPGVAGVIWVAAFLEEVVYRGVLFRSLEEILGTTAALWLQSLLFAAMHLANAQGSVAEQLTTLVSGTLIGAFWTALFVLTRNLWVVTAHHAAWNFAIILSGAPLSGLGAWREMGLVEMRDRGPGWLSGGIFGPEDSILTIALMAAGIAVVLRSHRTAARPGRGPND